MSSNTLSDPSCVYVTTQMNIGELIHTVSWAVRNIISSKGYHISCQKIIATQTSSNHYTKITFVRVYVRMYERKVTRSHSTWAKKLFFSASLDLGDYNRQPTDTAGYGDQSELLHNDGGAKLYWSLHLHKVAWWTQRSDILESMLSIGTFQEGGKSILSIFSWDSSVVIFKRVCMGYELQRALVMCESA
jgi:hypothetical protein